MNIVMVLYVAILFFALTPGVVLTLPDDPNSNKFVVAGVHAAVFATVFFLTYKIVASTQVVVTTNKQMNQPLTL